MKILTLVTVIIALPNTFFGMYGMNIDLPFQDLAGAYFLIVITTLAAIFGIVAYLRARRII